LIQKHENRLIQHINLQLPGDIESEASIIEVRKGIQEKIRFGCPHCNSDEIVGHGKLKEERGTNAGHAIRPLTTLLIFRNN
jgi:hypothetical protein